MRVTQATLIGLRATAIVCLSLASPVALAQAITVNSNLDVPAADPGSTTCQAAGGSCTLRAAVQAANNRSQATEIRLSAGEFRLSITGSGNDDASVGDLDILGDVTIVGQGMEATRIDGRNLLRVFEVAASGRLTLRDLSVVNGTANRQDESTGGCIQVSGGRLTLNRVRLQGCSANKGGAIAANGNFSVQLVGSHLTDNRTLNLPFTIRQGSAIRTSGNRNLDIRQSTISGNETGNTLSSLGTISMTNGSLRVHNSTISGNSARGIAVDNASVRLSFATLVDNLHANFSHFSSSGTYFRTVTSSVFRHASGGVNCLDNGDTVRPPSSERFNVASDFSCALTTLQDLQGVDPLLGPLANNGGPTPTHLPFAGSPLINQVSDLDCVEPEGHLLEVDQRGGIRPVGGACDIGAVELGGLEIFHDRFEPLPGS